MVFGDIVTKDTKAGFGGELDRLKFAPTIPRKRGTTTTDPSPGRRDSTLGISTATITQKPFYVTHSVTTDIATQGSQSGSAHFAMPPFDTTLGTLQGVRIGTELDITWWCGGENVYGFGPGGPHTGGAGAILGKKGGGITQPPGPDDVSDSYYYTAHQLVVNSRLSVTARIEWFDRFALKYLPGPDASVGLGFPYDGVNDQAGTSGDTVEVNRTSKKTSPSQWVNANNDPLVFADLASGNHVPYLRFKIREEEWNRFYNVPPHAQTEGFTDSVELTITYKYFK